MHQIELRLASHQAASAFAADTPVAAHLPHHVARTRDPRPCKTLATIRVILLTVSGLLALLTAASVTVIVAANMDARLHQIGTLKAVGVSPSQITAISLTEQLTIAVLATAVGAFAGTGLAVVIGQPAGDLLRRTRRRPS